MDEKGILRFRDGRTERAVLDPIDPSREVVTVQQDGGEKVDVPFSALKAVFFPRTVIEDSELEPASGSVARSADPERSLRSARRQARSLLRAGPCRARKNRPERGIA